MKISGAEENTASFCNLCQRLFTLTDNICDLNLTDFSFQPLALILYKMKGPFSSWLFPLRRHVHTAIKLHLLHLNNRPAHPIHALFTRFSARLLHPSQIKRRRAARRAASGRQRGVTVGVTAAWHRLPPPLLLPFPALAAGRRGVAGETTSRSSAPCRPPRRPRCTPRRAAAAPTATARVSAFPASPRPARVVWGGGGAPQPGCRVVLVGLEVAPAGSAWARRVWRVGVPHIGVLRREAAEPPRLRRLV